LLQRWADVSKLDERPHLPERDCLGKDGDTQLVVNHQGKHTHLGGTALVKLDGTLLELGFFIKSVLCNEGSGES